MDRRTVLQTTAGAAAASMALPGPAGAQQSQPQFPDYVSDAKGGTYEDLRGNDEVTVEVGAGSSTLAFSPTKIWIDPGTTVVFEWVSSGHNVLPNSQPDGANWEGSGQTLESKGHTYEFTFETAGMYTYYCAPHEAAGMKGAIAVGDDVPTGSGGGGGGTVQPKFSEYLSDAKGGTYEDLRGNDEVTVEVGAGSSTLAFLPTKIWIDPGTTVVFEWVSSGHNVVPNSQPDGAGWEGSGETLESKGFTYEFTFETAGIYEYYCAPHEAAGMKGGIAVGDDVPTRTVGGGGGGDGGGGGGDGGGVTLPGGSIGFTLFAITGGAVGIGVLSIFGAELLAAVRRSKRRASRAVGTAEDAIERELGHDEFDPFGTASLIVIYFLILLGMWIFVYFVEFLGGGPVVTG